MSKCQKIRYRTAKDAERALKTAQRAADAGIRRRLECRTYWCQYCGGWHLTSHPPDPGQPLLPGEVYLTDDT
jgi:hypothetical protein